MFVLPKTLAVLSDQYLFVDGFGWVGQTDQTVISSVIKLQ